MAAIVINDLHSDRTLDRKAMSAIRGAGGAPWVFGAFAPYRPSVPANASFGQIVNVYEINNFYADQMNNQFQSINVNNTAANSNISLAANQQAANFKH
ncbi:hypothetical protein D3870_05480 [Noviherbaspirillum cavernae]|uniref:Uncharacterized protein n=1 Tax=Noviherbaspirillum cavernae TaxID=2320862 RepID=A0A418WZ72_9BURK|nr:hypothetical protein [Noviherbaspirillum cavernae]RJG05538.1 hypothetical protein D3870_05480 [Noviherbaspirillum cavernae]